MKRNLQALFAFYTVSTLLEHGLERHGPSEEPATVQVVFSTLPQHKCNSPNVLQHIRSVWLPLISLI